MLSLASMNALSYAPAAIRAPIDVRSAAISMGVDTM